ncbi:MAG TPA: glutathione S-transferase N-terminal domain-containing protein [Thermoleophilaceae bacterium]|nr:glutathione S-transferase N-terminal domain-containing protein [Thermoleophilaceae bacterium]
MALKLHRCPFMFAKLPGHPCWNVQKALDEAGIAYEVVKEPAFRGKRDELEKHTGQRLLPAIELEDGTFLREESKDLVARIEEGRLPTLDAAQSQS